MIPANSFVFIKSQDNLSIPQKATSKSSGYDVVATSDPEIVGERFGPGYKRIDYIQYKTNIFLQPADGVHVLIHPRSSISKYNLMLKNGIGLCDSDYRGEYLLRFAYIWQPEDVTFLDPSKYPSFVVYPNLDKIYKKGDKIGQLLFEESLSPRLVEVEYLEDTARGDGAFGSTDKVGTQIGEMYK